MECHPRRGPSTWRRACAALVGGTLSVTAPVWDPGPARSETVSDDQAPCAGLADPASPAATVTRDVREADTLPLDGFGIQYWGDGYTAEGLARSPHRLLIVEATKLGAQDSPTGRERFFSPEEIWVMRHGGERPVLGYVSLTEIETYRDYWVEMLAGHDVAPDATSVDPPPVWYGATTSSGERLAAFWKPEWEAILMGRVDKLLALGFDGVFLDDALHYYSWAAEQDLKTLEHVDLTDAPKDASGFAQAMMGLVERLAQHARTRRCGFAVIVNNGVFIGRDAGQVGDAEAAFDRYRKAIDGIMAESVLGPTPQDQAIEVLRQDFQGFGVPVMTVDFASLVAGLAPPDYRALIAGRAAAAGFIPYVADDQAFDRLYPPLTAEATGQR